MSASHNSSTNHSLQCDHSTKSLLEMTHSTSNYLANFLDVRTNTLINFSATQFAEVWGHYDIDGNGFIEGRELDEFLREFIASVMSEEVKNGIITDDLLKELKKDFMEEFDQNNDNKIEIAELAHLLPTDEGFLLLFRRNNPLDSSVEFMRIWKQFDKDHSGFIEADELKEFISYMLKETQPGSEVSEEAIIEYTSTLLQLFDQNKDGKLQLSEMARLLPVKENYLCRPIFKNASKITSTDIDRVFNLYDQDRNGTIENEELEGFLKDLLSLAQEDYDEEDLGFFKRVILNEWDVNHDGKISRDELKMILLQQSKMSVQQTKSSPAHHKRPSFPKLFKKSKK